MAWRAGQKWRRQPPRQYINFMARIISLGAVELIETPKQPAFAQVMSYFHRPVPAVVGALSAANVQVLLTCSAFQRSAYGSENDICCHVTRRKISGGTRSDCGRECRDAFLGLAKSCTKLAISFCDYLGDRLAVPGAKATPQLPELVRAVPKRLDHRCHPYIPIESAGKACHEFCACYILSFCALSV
jgi:hypothetical protein